MTKLLTRMLLSGRIARLERLAGIYEQVVDPEVIAAEQLARFNTQWDHAWRNIPFYRHWRTSHGIPDRIDRLDQLAAFPVLTKAALSEARELVLRTPGSTRFSSTGGTTGASMIFPMGSADAETAWANTHLGRRWNGISPGDTLFMIWGHSHLFSGRAGRLKHVARQLKDQLLGITRVSAYSLGPDELAEIYTLIRRTKPRYVIGYASSIIQLCTYLQEQGKTLSDVGIHRVISTSEPLDPLDVPAVESIFGCPVANEYGMTEAGVIGYSVGGLFPIRIFWRDYTVHSEKNRLIVSTLGGRCFPLINYDTEDYCAEETPDNGTLLTLNALQGRVFDIFAIRDRDGKLRPVSVVIFDHILKQFPAVRTLHYAVTPAGEAVVSYTSADGPLPTEALQKHLVSGLAKDGIQVRQGDVEFIWLSAPLQTAAGKRRALTKGNF